MVDFLLENQPPQPMIFSCWMFRVVESEVYDMDLFERDEKRDITLIYGAR